MKQSLGWAIHVLSILTSFPFSDSLTGAVVQESKAGLAVGKLRTHESKEISDLAKDIVKKWKNEVGKEKQASGKPKPGATPTTPTTQKQAQRSAVSDGVIISVGDKTRDKCIELIYDALAFDSNAPSEQILTKAKDVEESVHLVNGGATSAYRGKIRSLYVNLKDKANPGLRESVVSGALDAAKLHTLSSSEMASEERKAADAKIEEENLFKSLGAGEQQAETDAFQCSRCKQRKCRYRQAQTRSADEPMTTFVTCTVCNNRWKFS